MIRNGQQKRKLQEALIDAFPTKISLEQMLWFELEKNLDSVAGGNNLEGIVFNLIRAAESQGWIEVLVHAALKSNSGNPKLKDVAEEVLTKDVVTATPASSPESPKIPQKLRQTAPLAQPKNHREALDAYRQEFEELLRTNNGTISPLSRRILDALRERLGIQSQEANSIEYGDIQSPYVERRQKLQEYVEALVGTFQYENLLRDVTRNQLKRYQQVLELNDEDIELIPGILGNVLYNQGKLDEALIAYKEAIHITPEDEVIRQNLGNVLIIGGYIEEAVIEYKEAIRINPNNVQLFTHLGNIFYNQDKFDEAIDEYRKALEIEQNNAEVRVHLALILYTQDKLDEAIHEYREAIRIAPNSADAYAGLGRALSGRKRFEEAVKMLEKAISIEPENGALYRDLGSVLYKQGNIEKAIAMFKETIKLDPHEAIAYTNLGAALYEQGQRKEAIETLEKASRFFREQNMIIEANRIDEALKQRIQGHQNWLSIAKKIFLW